MKMTEIYVRENGARFSCPVKVTERARFWRHTCSVSGFFEDNDMNIGMDLKYSNYGNTSRCHQDLVYDWDLLDRPA